MRTPASTEAPSAELAAEAQAWLRHLRAERRLSPKTVEAYGRDLGQFLRFCAETGAAHRCEDLSQLAPADLRAFLAARREAGVGNRSLGRQIAALRGLEKPIRHAPIFRSPRGGNRAV